MGNVVGINVQSEGVMIVGVPDIWRRETASPALRPVCRRRY